MPNVFIETLRPSKYSSRFNGRHMIVLLYSTRTFVREMTPVCCHQCIDQRLTLCPIEAKAAGGGTPPAASPPQRPRAPLFRSGSPHSTVIRGSPMRRLLATCCAVVCLAPIASRYCIYCCPRHCISHRAALRSMRSVKKVRFIVSLLEHIECSLFSKGTDIESVRREQRAQRAEYRRPNVRPLLSRFGCFTRNCFELGRRLAKGFLGVTPKRDGRRETTK